MLHVARFNRRPYAAGRRGEPEDPGSISILGLERAGWLILTPRLTTFDHGHFIVAAVLPWMNWGGGWSAELCVTNDVPVGTDNRYMIKIDWAPGRIFKTAPTVG